LLYAKQLEKWLNTQLSGKSNAHMFVNYSRKDFYA
jgi:hypothetical protein